MPSESSGGLGRRITQTPVAVLAELPLIGQGLSELIRGMRVFDVVGTSTHLDDVTELISCGAVRVVVISTSGREREFTQRALDGIQHAASRSGEQIGTVHVVSPGGSGSSEPADSDASAVVNTDDGVDGLARAVFEARRCHRPSSVRGTRRTRRPDAVRSRPAGERPTLTPRELEVLQGIADGLASKHIAERLGVSVHTVRTHVQRLLPKLGAHTRLRAIAVALEEGLVAQRPATRLASRYPTTAAGARSVRMAE